MHRHDSRRIKRQRKTHRHSSQAGLDRNGWQFVRKLIFITAGKANNLPQNKYLKSRISHSSVGITLSK